MTDFTEGYNQAIKDVMAKIKPRTEEPSVDPSNSGDVQDHAAWAADNHTFLVVSNMLGDVPLSYEQGVTAGFDEAIYEVRRGEIDPQTYQRKTT